MIRRSGKSIGDPLPPVATVNASTRLTLWQSTPSISTRKLDETHCFDVEAAALSVPDPLSKLVASALMTTVRKAASFDAPSSFGNVTLVISACSKESSFFVCSMASAKAIRPDRGACFALQASATQSKTGLPTERSNASAIGSGVAGPRCFLT